MVTAGAQRNSLATRPAFPSRRTVRAVQKRQVRKSGRMRTVSQLAQLVVLCSSAIALFGALAVGAAEILSGLLQSTLAGSLAVVGLMLIPFVLTTWHTIAPARPVAS